MASPEYDAFVEQLYTRLQILQNQYIHDQHENAQLVGPLLALTMLVKSDLLPFARDRYSAMVAGPQWRIADDHLVELRQEVEVMLKGPNAFAQRQVG
ncbi:hypothetical protein [Bermanella sp. R86510]|uniref:hypothetical protein n=1 Tax=unclassified Bermanella TaxID=2627862 RepID=UPI0037C58BB0